MLYEPTKHMLLGFVISPHIGSLGAGVVSGMRPVPSGHGRGVRRTGNAQNQGRRCRRRLILSSSERRKRNQRVLVVKWITSGSTQKPNITVAGMFPPG